MRGVRAYADKCLPQCFPHTRREDAVAVVRDDHRVRPGNMGGDIGAQCRFHLRRDACGVAAIEAHEDLPRRDHAVLCQRAAPRLHAHGIGGHTARGEGGTERVPFRVVPDHRQEGDVCAEGGSARGGIRGPTGHILPP